MGCTALVLCVHLVFGGAVYAALNNHLIDNQLTNQTQTAVALFKAVDQWRCDYEKRSLEIISNLRLQQYLRDGANQSASDLRRILTEYTGGGRMPEIIYVMDNGQQIVGTGNLDIKAYLFDRIDSANRYDGGVVWDSGYAANYVILYRKINDQTFDVTQGIGYLFMMIRISEILELYDDYRLHPSQRFSINGINNGFEATERGFFYEYYQSYLQLLHTEITSNGWKLRTWTDKSVALTPTRSLYTLLLVVMGITLFAAIIIILFFSSRMTRQLSVMNKAVKRFGVGEFDVLIPVVQDNEIGQLASTLNVMAREIQSLISELKHKDQQKRKIELQTMEYQINPHFLYNTLDSINMLARKNNDPVVADLVTALSRLFRLGLHKGMEIVLVRDEVMHVYYYLCIQSVRFEEQLTWRLDISEEINDLYIIKFILQPLVENAINHGIRKRESPGSLVVCGWMESNHIRFDVKDDGVGIPNSRLEAIRQVLASEQLEGSSDCFGLNNVNQRIRLHYGPGYSLRIETEEGVGTTISIRLPIERKG